MSRRKQNIKNQSQQRVLTMLLIKAIQPSNSLSDISKSGTMLLLQLNGPGDMIWYK